MTTAAPSTALATIQPAFTDSERLALAGFLAGYRGLTREAYALDLPVHHLVPRPLLAPVRRPPPRYRVLRPGAGSQRPGPRHRHPAAVHHRRVLQVRGRRRAPRAFPRRSRPPSAGGLRISCRRPGPQRTRRAPGRRRTRPASRACVDLAARAERAAGVRGHRVTQCVGPGRSSPDSRTETVIGRLRCTSARVFYANWGRPDPASGVDERPFLRPVGGLRESLQLKTTCL